MRHDQAGDAAPPQGIVDKFLRRGIEGAGRFVENKHRRVAHQPAGDFQPLPLAAAEIRPAFLHDGRISLRPEQDFVVDTGVARCGEDGFIRNCRVPQGDVVAQGREKERVFLRHHGNGPAQYFLGNLVPQMAVEQDLARPGLVEARDQARQGRLSGTAGTDHGDALPRLDHEVEILDQGRPALVEPEGDVSQFELACKLEPAFEGGDRFRFRISAAENGVFGSPGDVFETLQVCFERPALVGELQEAPDRRQKHLCQNVEADQSPESHVSGHDQTAPDTQDRGAAKRGDQAR